ncbi:MAG: hypothetical protein JST08_06575 [Actinobacteria bacterium]|nr:hypothetical protein [Actinomycetota bacterium]
MKYLDAVKQWGRLVAAAGAVLLVLAVPAGASARNGAHRRHVEVRRPTVGAVLRLGTDGGYQVNVLFEEPDLALLVVGKVDWGRLGVAETTYGTHFRGSLLGGRVSADFGTFGSLAVRFRPGGPVRERRLLRGCEGRPSRSESGRWVGKVSLHGEGDYFAISTGSAAGERDRSFRLRCHVRSPLPQPRPESLRDRVEPHVGASIVSIILGTVSSLQAVHKEGGRVVEMRAGHATGAGPGAEVEAGAFEYQGRIPVGRSVMLLRAPAGALITSLPGEHPATATLKPGVPFSGAASYAEVSATDHSWTGNLAVRFPGLAVPLTGTDFYTSLCVTSPLLKPHGCVSQAPNLQAGEESTGREGAR